MSRDPERHGPARLPLLLLLTMAGVAFGSPGPPAAAATGGIHTELDVVWGTAPDGTVLHADIRRPDRAGSFPVVMLLHGIHGDEDQMAPVASVLAASGYFAFAPEYTEPSAGAPVDPSAFEAALDELDGALTYMAGRPDADLSRLGLFGASWGAILAMLGGETDARVDAVVAWSGDAGHPPMQPWVKPAPLFACHSTVDPIVPYQYQLEAQALWGSYGSPHRLYSTRDLVHGINFWYYVDPRTHRTECGDRSLDWLDRHVKNA
jgi:dienelactone hydrolase